MESKIYMKTLKNFSEKLRNKISKTTLSYSIVKIARLDDAFSDIIKL